MSESGTYVLVVDVPQATTLEIGALGEREFAAGTYAYVGSAFGPGEFAAERADRRLRSLGLRLCGAPPRHTRRPDRSEGRHREL